MNGGVIGDLLNIISQSICQLGIWGTPIRQILHFHTALLVLGVAIVMWRDSCSNVSQVLPSASSIPGSGMCVELCD